MQRFSTSHWTLWLYRIQLALAGVIIVAIGIDQFGFIAPLTAFLMTGLCIALIAITGVVGLLLLLVSLFVRSNAKEGNPKLWAWRRNSLVALLIGVLPLGVVWLATGGDAFSKPLIHDITTDVDNPPQFTVAVAARSTAENPLDYPGAETAQIQQEFYPDIKAIDTALNPAAAFERALKVVDQLGWQVLSENPAAGMIEAVDETRLFAFKDDIAIRITSQNGGSRVDLRSVSRVGQGDLGANAARIRRFEQAFERETE